MGPPDPLELLGSKRDPKLAHRARLIAGLLYPGWHFLAPAGGVDPWWPWLAIAACFVVTGLLPTRGAFLQRYPTALADACSWVLSLHWFLLAYANGMHPFYAVGSVLSVLIFAYEMQSRGALVAYGAFVLSLAACLIALAPSTLALAFWAPLTIVLGLRYFTLSIQLRAAGVVRRCQDELEERVTERTRELSEARDRLKRELEERLQLQEQLRLSQKLEALGRLAGGVAHDFNNLLTTIRGYGDLLLDSLAPDDERRPDVHQILEAEGRAAELIKQLMAFSRQGVIETSLLDLNAVIREMDPMLRSLVGEDTDLVTELEDDIGRIRANRAQVDQVLVNLTLNARHAMPSGGRLTIGTSRLRARDLPFGDPATEGRGEFVVLTATDTGVGMDAETRERAFEPFYTTRQVDQGTGLGLATVYGTVKQAGGHARVLSEPGKGARFELYWPSVFGARDERVPPSTRQISARGMERILLVEDEESIRTWAHRALERSGYSVLDAADGPSALRIAEEEDLEIDLVVTDVVMPRMNGFELADRLATTRPKTRVLFISGHLEHPALESGFLPSDEVLLAKPFSPHELTTKVRAVLDQPRT